MRKTKICFGLVIILISIIAFFKMVNAMGTFIIIPEPHFPVSDTYEINQDAMREYYTKLFHSMTASDAITMLEKNNVEYRFDGGNKIIFFVEKTFIPIPVKYSGSIEISFLDGVFQRVSAFRFFGIDAP
ncbi:hypothetical protein [Thioclava sp. GXIMD4215]|uniref:hypothetical protein n=1 Tax=Thioclava sp. GXIMD4215 TaxID=3131928 RepID=UPI00311AE928